MPKKPVQFRFTRATRARLRWLADRSEKDHTALLEQAVEHLYGTAIRELPTYANDPIPVVKLEDDEDAGTD